MSKDSKDKIVEDILELIVENLKKVSSVIDSFATTLDKTIKEKKGGGSNTTDSKTN